MRESSSVSGNSASARAGLVDAPGEPRLELLKLHAQLIDALSHPHLNFVIPCRFCGIEEIYGYKHDSKRVREQKIGG